MGDRLRGGLAVCAVAWRADRWRTAGTVVFGIGSQAMQPVYSVALGWLTDAVVTGDRIAARNAVLLYAAVVLSGQLTAVISFPMRMHLREKTTHAVDQELVDLAGRVPGIEHFERAEYADKVELLRAYRIQIAGVPDALVYNIAVPVQILVTAVVLEEGRVVEGGTHDELLALGGRYATMFELQAARYLDGPDDEEAPEAGEVLAGG